MQEISDNLESEPDRKPTHEEIIAFLTVFILSAEDLNTNLQQLNQLKEDFLKIIEEMGIKL